MNHVAMTISSLRKENSLRRGSNQRPPVFKSFTLATKLQGLGGKGVRIYNCFIPKHLSDTVQDIHRVTFGFATVNKMWHTCQEKEKYTYLCPELSKRVSM